MKSDLRLSTRKKILFTAAVLLAVIICFAASELYFTFNGYSHISPLYRERTRLFVNHDIYGFHHNPGIVESARCPPVRINGQGYREDREIPIDRPENEAVRILTLGDSVVFGLNVANEQGLCCRLESLLDEHLNRTDPTVRCEVINTGVMCWSPGQYNLFYRREGRRFRPDFVLIGLNPNDVTDCVRFDHYDASRQTGDSVAIDAHLQRLMNGINLTCSGWDQRTGKKLLNFAYMHSATFAACYENSIGRRKKQINEQREELIRNSPFPELSESYRDHFSRLLEQTTEPEIVLVFPSRQSMEGRVSPDYPYEMEFRRLTGEISRNHGSVFVDMADVYRDYLARAERASVTELYVSREDRLHPSAVGHFLTAETVFGIVREKIGMKEASEN
ncbi:hypothetical protein JXA40_05690 [bacterium]|nr:hypothetical protein [candidate division CSSED10-310 bacterium]